LIQRRDHRSSYDYSGSTGEFLPRGERPLPTGDPYLTIKDICAELRVSHETVRQWLISGRLPYVKAGRNYRVRRSGLDRMLAEGTPSVPSPRRAQPTQPKRARQARTGEDAIARLDLAQQRWTTALQAHWSAPPAPGFAERLMQLANAAEQQSSAFRLADREGLTWRRLPGASASLRPPPELGPDFNRPGPAELWDRFDDTVRDLGVALEGISSVRIAQVFERLSESLRELSYANRPQESKRRRRAG
jgi:excisionase family DNA binding protein